MANLPKYEPDRQLTVGVVADFCQVNRVTVQRWIHAGRLKAYTLPGGHYRVRAEDLRDFFLANGMPLPALLKTESERRGKRILIVDDSSRDRLLLNRALADRGWNVQLEESDSGIDALIRIGDWKPDLVILDIIMPRMDGFEVVRKIAENPRTRTIDILIVTGYSIDQARRDLEDYRIAGFLSKPVDIHDVRDTVRRLLHLTDPENE